MPCSRGYLGRKSLDFQKQKTEEKQMKKVAKYGITLLSVAVLGVATIPMVVSADVNETTVGAPATNTEEKKPLQFTIDYLDERDYSTKVSPTDTITLNPGEKRTLIPKEIEGYKSLSSPRWINYELVEFGAVSGFSFIYKKVDQPDSTPKPDPTPQPSPNPTPAPTPQPKPEPEPQPDPKPAPQPGDDNKGGQAKPDDNGKGDGKAENPADNQKPADKDVEKQPEGEKPTDNSKASDQSKKSETVKPKATEDKKEETKNKLPNTGEAVSSLGFLGVGLLSSLGLTKKRYKGRHERH